MSRQDDLAEAIAEAAARWTDPEHPARAEAEARTLETPGNRFTEAGMAFAVNQQMSLLTAEALRAWRGARLAPRARTVGALAAGNIPLGELQDFLAVLLTGHRYVGALSSRSPHLLPAFAGEVRRFAPAAPLAFATAEQLFAEADALLATGSDETMEWVGSAWAAHGKAPERLLRRGRRYGAAVLDGRETADERERLAEDALLHDGYGCRNVAVVWAPEGLEPDAYLEAFAAFRGVFPAHPSLAPSLKMPAALLGALGRPHAHGEGYEFLLSRGEPEPQPPGHVRWSVYTDLGEVAAWMQARRASVQVVTASPRVAARLVEAPGAPVEALGMAQQPALDWAPDGLDTMAFLHAL